MLHVVASCAGLTSLILTMTCSHWKWKYMDRTPTNQDPLAKKTVPWYLISNDVKWMIIVCSTHLDTLMSYSTVKSWCSSENNSCIQSFLASTSVSLSIDTYVGNFLRKSIHVRHACGQFKKHKQNTLNCLTVCELRSYITEWLTLRKYVNYVYISQLSTYVIIQSNYLNDS